MAKVLLDVLNGRRPGRRPIWMMRQAGRYLPEYRAVRQQAGSFLDLCYQPKLAAEVTLQPLRRFDLDAAIVFADILLLPHVLGCDLRFVENEGPQLSVVRDAAGVKALLEPERPWQFERVYETLAMVKDNLSAEQALIGFCGAPWTVASYMIEGRGSDRRLALSAAQEGADWFVELIRRVVELSVSYLVGQVRAGAETLQIFDSWAGDLPSSLHSRWVYAPIAAIVAGVRAVYPDIPIIVFGRGLGLGHASLAVATGASAVGIEQGFPMRDVAATVPKDVAIQGNLDPEILKSGGDEMRRAVVELCQAVPLERHVFNLGHGILQQTPAEHVSEVIALVRGHDAKL